MSALEEVQARLDEINARRATIAPEVRSLAEIDDAYTPEQQAEWDAFRSELDTLDEVLGRRIADVMQIEKVKSAVLKAASKHGADAELLDREQVLAALQDLVEHRRRIGHRAADHPSHGPSAQRQTRRGGVPQHAP